MKNKPRLLLVFAFSLVFALAAGAALAAGGANKPPAAGPNTLTVAMFGEPPTLDPVAHNSQVGELFNMQNYNGLFFIDKNLNPQPDLCESYQQLSATEWVFKLRRGVKFHNGAEMHAEDVVASLQRTKANPRVSRFAAKFTTIEALDEYTVKIVTDGPYSDTLYDLSHTGTSICPKALIDAKNDFNKNPVGTGPFKYRSWVLGDRLTMDRFDGYFNPARKAKVQTIIFRFIPEASSRTIALEMGEVDVVHQVETMDIARLRKTPGITVDTKDTISLISITLNNEMPGLNNLLVRKALTAAVDHEAVIKVAVNGYGISTDSQVPSMPGGSDAGVTKHDMEQAKKYMAESGVNPASLDITIVCTEEHRRRIAEVIQAEWAELGVNAKIDMMEVATFLTRASRGEIPVSVSGYSNKSLLAWIKTTFSEASIGASAGSPRMRNKAVEAQIAVAESAVDPAQRIAELEKLSKMINEATPKIPLYEETMFKAYNSNIDGVPMEPNGQVYYWAVGWVK